MGVGNTPQQIKAGLAGSAITRSAIKKTLKNALNPDKFSIAGSGKQVRDVLHADDLVSLYLKAYENADIMNGIVFNIGGGKTTH